MPEIPAARSTLAVLRYLAARNGPVRAATLARDLAHAALVGVPADRRDDGRGLPRALPRGPHLRAQLVRRRDRHAALRGERLGMLARPLLERLVAEVAASDRVPTVAHLAVLGGADVIYAARVQGFRAPDDGLERRRAPARPPDRDRTRDARRPGRRPGAGDLPDPRPAHPAQRRRARDPRRARPAARRDARARLRDRGRRRHGRVRLGGRGGDRPARLPGGRDRPDVPARCDRRGVGGAGERDRSIGGRAHRASGWTSRARTAERA